MSESKMVSDIFQVYDYIASGISCLELLLGSAAGILLYSPICTPIQGQAVLLILRCSRIAYPPPLSWPGQPFLQLPWSYPPTPFFGALTVFFAILGCFLDGIYVVVLTTSVVIPR
jgi:hypothetical protein